MHVEGKIEAFENEEKQLTKVIDEKMKPLLNKRREIQLSLINLRNTRQLLIARRNRHYKVITQMKNKGFNSPEKFLGSMQKYSEEEISDDVLANIIEDSLMKRPCTFDNNNCETKKIKPENK